MAPKKSSTPGCLGFSSCMAPLPGMTRKSTEATAALNASEMESIDVENGPAFGPILPLRVSWQKSFANLCMYVLNTFITYASITGVFGATNRELSEKYQTLVTPAGWTFSIWGLIFIWEGVFVVAQFLPRLRASRIVVAISPWWWGLCIAQVAWVFAFAQERLILAAFLMFGILATLLGISWATFGMELSTKDYLLLKAPFSLQLGWIVAASVVSVNVVADAAKWSQGSLLNLALISDAVLLIVVAIFTFIKHPDPIVGLVAAWAFAGIASELDNPVYLNNKTRFNPQVWDPKTLSDMQSGALWASVLAAGLASVAAIQAQWKRL